MRYRRGLLVALLGILLLPWLLAEGTRGQAARPAVKILFPNEGSRISAGDIRVTVTMTGAILVAADDSQDQRTGHFHLYMDKVPDHAGRPIPKGVEGIWHFSERFFVLKSASPGLHTLILIWAYGNHVPYSPWISDTIMFEAR